MGSALSRNVNAIRDEYNGRRRTVVKDPPTTPTRYARKYIIVGSNNGKMKYPLPINKIWSEDQHHYLLRYLWQSNFSTPIENSLKRGDAKVLDVGCGTGIWLFEMAKDYPESKFIGVDITTTFPTNHRVKNLKFQQNDLLKGLPFEDDTFDLVSVRLVGNSFSEKEREEKIMKELIKVTKPGSYIEITKMDFKLSRCGPNLERWNDALLSYFESINVNGSICEKFENWVISEDQFSNVRHEVIVIPVGAWGNKIGELGISYIRYLSLNLKSKIITHLNMTENEYDDMMNRIEIECEQHMVYMTTHRFIAQKKY